MKCPEHPEIELPHMLTCPLCAQEARRRAYEVQKATAQRASARFNQHGDLIIRSGLDSAAPPEDRHDS